jgi:endonuclease YncB( thermonuclease family)
MMAFSRCLVLLCILSCSVLGRETSAAFQSCTVTEVYDGDTLTAFCDARSVRLRVSSIDAPEIAQSWGTPARDFARRLLVSSIVTVQPVDQDQYGRTVARLTLSDGRDFARIMVRSGLAFHYIRYSTDPELASLESAAREENLGIWAFGGSERPDEFRATSRKGRMRARIQRRPN